MTAGESRTEIDLFTLSGWVNIRADSGSNFNAALHRNTLDMITIVEKLHEKGVSVTFIDDNLSTAGDMGYMLITILSAVAQAERARILERTNEGRQAAMDNGIRFGRKPHQGAEKAIAMIRKGVRSSEVIAAAGVSRATYFRLKKSVGNYGTGAHVE
jgi:DNA invertase Pin-like site-specific DNA recombinase